MKLSSLSQNPHLTPFYHTLLQNRPLTEAEKIQDEVQRQVAKCTCVHRFKVFQVGEGKYRVSGISHPYLKHVYIYQKYIKTHQPPLYCFSLGNLRNFVLFEFSVQPLWYVLAEAGLLSRSSS